jgi:protocatechuate 3,4-dioxygenase beta subunit
MSILLAGALVQSALRAQPGGLLTGYVTWGDTGLPASRIHVRVLDRLGATRGAMNPPPDGRFSINLRPGVYRIAIDLPPDETRYLGGVVGAEGTSEEGDLFRVRADSERVLRLALKPAASLGGRVVDSDSRPLKNLVAHVDPNPAANNGSRIQTHRAATTDADGQFLVSGLAPGTYRVAVDPPDTQAPESDGGVLLPTYYPDRRRPTESIGVQVSAGGRVDGLQIVMIRGVARSATGKVVDVNGQSAWGRQVFISRNDTTGRSGVRTGQEQSRELPFSTVVRTDISGRFIVDQLAAGHYDATAYGNAGEWGVVSFDVNDVNVNDLVVQIRPPVRLGGRIVFEESDHPPFPWLGIELSALAHEPLAPGAVSRSDGTFELDLSGTRMIHVRGVPKGWHLKAIRIGGKNVVNAVVDAPDTRTPVIIVLGTRMASLAGRVEHAGETDAVLAIADDSSTWTAGSSQLAIAEVDEDGEFRFDALLPGDYHVAVVSRIPSGFRTGDQAAIGSLIAGAIPVRLTDGDERHVVIASRSGRSESAPGSGLRRR